jgi:iron complex outermembrane recepter protein
LNGAARVTSTKAVRKSDGASDKDTGEWTYKIAANWSPVRPVRLRATYGTSFRSPALFEQFLNNETGFLAQSQVDPCIQWQNSQDQRIVQRCSALGIPSGYAGAGASAQTNSQGNVGTLDPETSKAFTLSAIFTPSAWLWEGGQFSLAVDYIDIKVKDQVTQLGAGTIVQSCFTSDFYPTDPLCSLFTRDMNPNSGTAWNVITVNDPYFNIDRQRNTSIDVTARYRQNLGNMGSLSLLGQMTFQTRDEFNLFEGTFAEDNGEVGDPKWVGTLNATWTKRPFTVTYGLQVISGTNDIEDLQASGGTATTANNCFATAAAYQLRGGPYCPIYKLPRVAYHSLSAEYDLNRNISILAGVSNLFDQKPPQASTVGSVMSIGWGNTPINGSYYDFFGRRFFVSAKAKLSNLGLPF